MTLEWLLAHPELDSSNDIEEALHGTYGKVSRAQLVMGSAEFRWCWGGWPLASGQACWGLQQ